MVTEETLSNVARLRLWFDYDSKRPDAKVKSSEASWANVQAAAAKARSAHGIDDRIALFKWLVFGENWNYVRLSDEDLAATLRREAERSESFTDLAAFRLILPNFELPEGVL